MWPAKDPGTSVRDEARQRLVYARHALHETAKLCATLSALGESSMTESVRKGALVAEHRRFLSAVRAAEKAGVFDDERGGDE